MRKSKVPLWGMVVDGPEADLSSKPRRKSRSRSRKPGPRENGVYHFMFRVSIGQVEPDAKQIEGMREALKEKFLCKMDKYVYQLEKGEKGTYHFQGYSHSKDKHRADELGRAMQSSAVNVQWMVQPAHDTTALKSYSMKKDSRVAGPWADHPIYLGADLPKDMFAWQAKVEKMCLAENSSDRHINWVFDSKGNKGKSKFVKMMMYHHEWPVFQFADAKDLMNLVSKFMHKKAYFFDLTRTKPAAFSSKDIYSCMEQIKNGLIQNVKYETSIQMMNPPHLWVFANQPPEFKSLTHDRWKVWTIADAPALTLEPYLVQRKIDTSKMLVDGKEAKDRDAKHAPEELVSFNDYPSLLTLDIIHAAEKLPLTPPRSDNPSGNEAMDDDPFDVL